MDNFRRRLSKKKVPVISLSPDQISVNAMTGNMRVYVFANSEPYYGSISASCNDNWVSINTSSGGYIYGE